VKTAASVAGKILSQVRPHKLNTGPWRILAGCIWFGHHYSTAAYPPACVRCGKPITLRP
jgi:hypothetical protein